MKKAKATVSIIILVVALFLLSYVLTVIATRVIGKKEVAVPVQPIEQVQPRIAPPMGPKDYIKLAREFAMSASFDAASRREDAIERGAAAFQDDEDLLLLQREVRVGRMLSSRPISDEALRGYAAYIASIERKHPSARLDLAIVLMRAGRLDEAIAKLKEFLSIEPDNAICQFLLGKSYAKKEMFSESIRHLRRAREQCGEYIAATALLQQVERVQNLCKLQRIEGPFWESLSKQEDVPVEGLVALGNLMLWLDEPAEAVKAFKLAVKRDSANVEAHVGLGKAYFRQSADYPGLLSPKDRLNLLYEAGKELDIAHLLRPYAQYSLARFAFDFQKMQMLRDWLQIASAIMLYHHDTGQWPGKGFEWLFTDLTGKLPHLEAIRDWRTKAAPCSDYLVMNRDRVPGWAGPYLLQAGSDPWEYCYLISVGGFFAKQQSERNVWCISAGPNWIIQTPAYAKEVSDDDLGMCIMRDGRVLPDTVDQVAAAMTPLREAERKWYTRLVSAGCDKMLLFGQKFPEYSRLPRKLYLIRVAEGKARKVGDNIQLHSEVASVDWDAEKVYTVMRVYDASLPKDVVDVQEARGQWQGEYYLMEFDIATGLWRPIFRVDEEGNKHPIEVAGRVIFLPKKKELFFCSKAAHDRGKPEQEYDLYRYDLQAGRLRLVFSNIASVPGTPRQWFAVTNDGQMVFVVKDIGRYGKSNFSLHAVGVDGEVKKVFSSEINEAVTDFYSCSPENTRLLFGTRPGRRGDPLTAELNVNLWILSIPDMTVRRVLSTRQSYITPQWERDGRTFSYLQWYRRQIVQYDTKGRLVGSYPLHEMAMDKLSWVNPQWSIDSDIVVYIARDEKGTAAVWTTDLDAKELKKVLELPGL